MTHIEKNLGVNKACAADFYFTLEKKNYNTIMTKMVIVKFINYFLPLFFFSHGSAPSPCPQNCLQKNKYVYSQNCSYPLLMNELGISSR